MTRAWITILFLGVALALAGCAASTAETSPDQAAPPSTAAVSPQGTVAAFRDGFDASLLGGIDLPRGIPTDRMRVKPPVEERFVQAVREDPNTGTSAPMLDEMDDDAVLYLGYLYCAGMDAGLSIDRAVAGVVDVVARAEGRDPTAPDTGDYVASVTIVNLSAGSLCPELYLDTRDFLEQLTGGA